MITTTHKEHRIPVKRQCRFHGIAFRQIHRWLNPPEPDAEQSCAEVDMVLEEFRKLMQVELDWIPLTHTARRSYGSGKLHARLKGRMPRRRIQQTINDERKSFNRDTRAGYTRLSWKGAMSCWAMDDTHIYTDQNGVKQWIHNIKDLTSQYILPPVTGAQMTGEQVAENLRKLFKRFGAPLVLKRDNGPNLCNAAVNNVLDEFGVIPLTSPAYYSRYNGSIEQANGRLKERIKVLTEEYKCEVNKQTAAILSALAAHDENTHCKRSINRQTPSYQFFKTNKNAPGKSVRREVMNDIKQYIQLLTEEYSPSTKSEKNSVKRKAVEAVLEKRGYINVTQSQGVLPLF